MPKAQTPRTFSGPNLSQIAMPMGGLGAGCVCLNGHGGLEDFSIHHKPATTALSQLGENNHSAFGVLHVKGEKSVTKLLEGPLPDAKIYAQGINMAGYRKSGHEGLPRFSECSFTNQFPFGEVLLSHPDVPLEVKVTGWNPFIPRDDKNSGLPCVVLEYSFRNRTRREIEFEFSYHLSNFAAGKERAKEGRSAMIPNAGVLFSNTDEPHEEFFGTAALCAIGFKPKIKTAWLEGGWFDSLSALWREVSEGKFSANKGGAVGQGGSILIGEKVAPGQSVSIPIVIAWHFPNCGLVIGRADVSNRAPEGAGMLGTGCCTGQTDAPPPTWRPFYAGQWNDAGEVAHYVRKHYNALRSRTMAFKDALFSSTVPPAVLDAVASNLAILKSPTILRQENGNVWGWEGCQPTSGCCAGSCTHVWNYAQAMPHLFPQLERTLREQEYSYSLDERGHVNFRAALPDGPPSHDFHAAADGQLGGVMKLFRDWQICGDANWMKGLYPLAKSSLEYCIETWDPKREGALCEPHHNTYDIEFWGPDGMCCSVYVGALAAMSEMAKALGFDEDALEYSRLAEKGASFLDEELWNGEYFHQRVMWKGLRDKSFEESLSQPKAGIEMQRILKTEGPKYQYGKGCLSDGAIGAWMAQIYGIASPQSRPKIKQHLHSVWKHNFKSDLSTHACTQRAGYAIGHEAGLLLCSWPRGEKPTLPFVYCDEVWTGIEYQVASHLIEEGLVDEGLTIVQAVRERYDGRVRNPFNEYECGSYYARAMASYALLNSLSGFRYSAASKTLWLSPKMNAEKFKTFFSTNSGFGTISLDKSTLAVEMIEGELVLERVILNQKEKTWNTTAQAGEKASLKIAA